MGYFCVTVSVLRLVNLPWGWCFFT